MKPRSGHVTARSGVMPALALVVAQVVASGDAAAAPSTTAVACVAAYDQGMKLEDEGDFLHARSELRTCGAASCPSALQRECVASLSALETRIPTVVFVVRDDQRRDLTEVAVLLDGASWKGRLDGREAEVNPGPHRFRFEAAGFVPFEQSFLVNERDKGRVLDVALERAATFGPVAAGREHGVREPRSALEYVLAGIDGAGLVTSGVLGALGLSARSDANACRPSCSSGAVDTVNHRFLAADVALGVGVVSLVAAAWLELRRAHPR